MDQFLILLLLAFLMLSGSFLAGIIPLIFDLSDRLLRNFTIFGAGLLVGTALTVIIPEGIRALLSSVIPIKNNAIHQTEDTMTTNFISDSCSLASENKAKIIGISLLLGFIIMLVIDQLSRRRKQQLHLSTATIGLVVHAAADGIALGAAASTKQSDIEVIVFIAIMLHKAPAAFGLVSFLLHEGLTRREIRRHLIIFAVAAPIATIVTYLVIGRHGNSTLTEFNGTGIAMLFSGGTFLYVATVHILPELNQHNIESRNLNDITDVLIESNDIKRLMNSTSRKSDVIFSNIEIFILILGAVTPIYVTVRHEH